MPGRVTVKDARQWAQRVLPLIAEVRSDGAHTLQEIANALNTRGVTTLRGAVWTSMSVWRLLRQAADGRPPERR